MSGKTEIDISASCGCGAATIRVRGPIRTTMLCACTECQKASGSGHSALAVTSPQCVRTQGELKRFARPADSGAELSRYFCPGCAVTLFATTSRRPDLVLLPVGIFSDQSWFNPKQVIFNRSRSHWDSLPEIPAYDTYRDAADERG